jgi:hypothetical protein
MEELSLKLLLLGGIISMLASMMTLMIIYNMGKWTGNLLSIIGTMTVFQMLFDTTFIMAYQVFKDPNGTPGPLYYLYSFVSFFAGLTATFWTNIISAMAYYIVRYIEPAKISKYFKHYFILATVPSLIFAIIATTIEASNSAHAQASKITHLTFNSLKLLSIIFNIGIYCLLQIRIYNMGNQHSIAMVSICTLAARLKYYPIVQTITRLPATIYVFVYTGTGYANDHRASRIFANFLYDLTTPLGGLGFFLVFMSMQPMAKHHFMRIVTCSWLRVKMKERFAAKEGVDEDTDSRPGSYSASNPTVFGWDRQYSTDDANTSKKDRRISEDKADDGTSSRMESLTDVRLDSAMSRSSAQGLSTEDVNEMTDERLNEFIEAYHLSQGNREVNESRSESRGESRGTVLTRGTVADSLRIMRTTQTVTNEWENPVNPLHDDNLTRDSAVSNINSKF